MRRSTFDERIIMFLYRGRQFLVVISLIMLLKDEYVFLPAEAVNGVVWSKNKSDFVPISSMRSFQNINQQDLLISHEIEHHDFNGTLLRLTSYPIENLVTFTDNDTVVTGVEGDTWNFLSDMLNFRIHAVKFDNLELGSRSENGSWDGLLGYIHRNETDIIPRCAILTSRLTALDYTFATWKTTFRFYMKKQPQYHKTWMVELFNRGLWFSIIGLFFAVTLASYSVQTFNSVTKNSDDFISNLRDHFFYIFSIFCNQGWTPQQLGKHTKILILSTRLFAWLLVIAFSSTLTSHIAQRRFYPPFHDLESFYKDTNYTLIVKGNIYSIFQTSRRPIYKTIINAGRLIRVDDSEEYEKLCTGKYVYLESDDLVEAKNRVPCEIAVVGKPYFTAWIAGGVTRGFKYRKSLDLGILKLFEFGIIHRLKSKWLRKTTAIKMSDAFESIRFEHVALIFVMLCSAIALSFVILLIENIFHLGPTPGRRTR